MQIVSIHRSQFGRRNEVRVEETELDVQDPTSCGKVKTRMNSDSGTDAVFIGEEGEPMAKGNEKGKGNEEVEPRWHEHGDNYRMVGRVRRCSESIGR